MSPRRDGIRVAVDLSLRRDVAIATSVACHVTKHIRVLRGHLRQRDPQRGRRVDGKCRLELHRTELDLINARRDVISASQLGHV